MDSQFLTYNALDSACMMEIEKAIWPKLQKEYQKSYDMTIALMEPVMAMQARGMNVNRKLLGETKSEIVYQRDLKQAELDRMAGRHINVNSNKDCCQFFYIERGLPVITGRETKAASVNDAALQRMIRGTVRNPSVPEAKLVQEIRGLSKLFNTYLNATFDDDGRLRGSYNLRGTKFGRLSSSKTIEGTGMNYQNLPQEFKKFLTADDGYILLEADKRQAEWVVVAYFSDDANMKQAIESGEDVHAHTASLMFNLPVEVIKYEANVIGHKTNSEEIYHLRMNDRFLKKIYTPQWPRSMSFRQCGKKSNHGLNYDEGPNNFALINEMEIPEAKRIVEMYHTIYPGIRRSYERIKKSLQNGRHLSNCFGRSVYFMGDFSKDMYKAAYAMIPQSTVVDSVNIGMCKLYADTYLTRQCNVDLLAQVHDSMLIQIPIEVTKDKNKMDFIVSKTCEYMSPEMNYSGNTFKIATDIKVGLNWGEQKKETNPSGMREYTSYENVLPLLGV